jgi:hypothetical protein
MSIKHLGNYIWDNRMGLSGIVLVSGGLDNIVSGNGYIVGSCQLLLGIEAVYMDYKDRKASGAEETLCKTITDL